MSKRSIKEEFAGFFEDPTRDRLRDILKGNVGELSNLDFKEKWPAYPKVARHLLGMGNSNGGCIIVGVSEKDDKSLDPIGLDKLEDKSSIIDGIKNYFPNSTIEKILISDFVYEESEYSKIKGKKFQAIIIEVDPEDLPLIAKNEFKSVIRKNAIYVRRGASTEEANYEELQKIINLRLSTGYSSQSEMDLKAHLEQLKVLFSHLERYNTRYIKIPRIFEAISAMKYSLGETESVPNPLYPEEDFEKFVIRLIDRKKLRIERELDR